MKRILLLSGFLIILFSACKKQTFNDTRQATIDDLKIQAYIKANHIDAVKDPSGLYYQIITTNPGPHPTLSDTVKITTTGTLLNGTQFQSQSIFIQGVSTFIKGFQIGIPLLGTNGAAPFARIRLIIPSALGYGSAGSPDGSVPSNACLAFLVDLQGFYN